MSKLFLLAVRNREQAQVREFLASGVDVNFQDETGQAAIHEAVLNLDLDMIELLASYQADLDLRNECGLSAFNHVVDEYVGDEAGISPVIDLLCRLSANPNHATLNGDTVLHYMAFNGYTALAIQLIQAGANARLRNLAGMTPRDEALDGAKQGLADMLERVEIVQTLMEQNQLPRLDLNVFRELSIEDPCFVERAKRLSAVRKRVHTLEGVRPNPVVPLIHSFLTPQELTFFSSTAHADVGHKFLFHSVDNHPPINVEP